MFMLKTERLIFRDFKNEDIPNYIALRDNDKFKRFYSCDDVTKVKSAALIEMFILQSKEVRRTVFQLAILTKDETLIGSCGIRIEGEHQASIGCELGRKWQNAGYAYEAAREMLNYGFTKLKLHRIYAETISENKAAVRLCQLLGMRIEAELVENRYFQDRWWNTSIFGLLNREWRYESG